MRSFVWFCLFCFVSCSQLSFDGYKIDGNLLNTSGGYIYLDELTSTSILPVDSAEIDENGLFVLEGQIKEIGFYRLRISSNNFINIVLDPNDTLTVDGDATNLYGTYAIKGSKDAILLYEFNDYNRGFGMKTDSLRRLAGRYSQSSSSDSLSRLINAIYNKLLSERKEFARQFVIDNTNSITALAAAESLDPSSDLKLYVDLDKALIELYPDLSYVKSFHARVAQLSKLAIGSEAPQIVLPDTLGNPLDLSSFRGKVVLIDFWASWCKPCRFENPNVVRLYEKYKDKGFEIYGVSLDKTKPAWMKAIKQDGLKWPQVSDLGFWNSAAVKLYGIESIPQTYLLDEEGVIIGKGLRGKALEDKLMQVLDAG